VFRLWLLSARLSLIACHGTRASSKAPPCALSRALQGFRCQIKASRRERPLAHARSACGAVDVQKSLLAHPIWRLSHRPCPSPFHPTCSSCSDTTLALHADTLQAQADAMARRRKVYIKLWLLHSQRLAVRHASWCAPSQRMSASQSAQRYHARFDAFVLI